jgi:antirestriction protein ArdC
MGAAFLCQDYRIAGELRHDGYIQSWLKVLKEDSKAIFKSAALTTWFQNHNTCPVCRQNPTTH